MEEDDDIDRLLDQIEKRYNSRAQSQQSIQYLRENSWPGGADLQQLIEDENTAAENIRPTLTSRQPEDSELSYLIEDIRSATELLMDAESESQNQIDSNSPNLLQQQRCFKTYMGGSSVDVGLNATGCFVNPRGCANLRCVDCDFSVIHLDDHAWHSSIDYLFLRNHMPDTAKLRTGLVTKRGCRAYACQCAWRNVEHLEDVKNDSTLKWICGKH